MIFICFLFPNLGEVTSVQEWILYVEGFSTLGFFRIAVVGMEKEVGLIEIENRGLS